MNDHDTVCERVAVSSHSENSARLPAGLSPTEIYCIYAHTHNTHYININLLVSCVADYCMLTLVTDNKAGCVPKFWLLRWTKSPTGLAAMSFTFQTERCQYVAIRVKMLNHYSTKSWLFSEFNWNLNELITIFSKINHKMISNTQMSNIWN